MVPVGPQMVPVVSQMVLVGPQMVPTGPQMVPVYTSLELLWHYLSTFGLLLHQEVSS